MARSCLFVTSLEFGLMFFNLSRQVKSSSQYLVIFISLEKTKRKNKEPSKESKEMSIKTDKTKDIQLLRR